MASSEEQSNASKQSLLDDASKGAQMDTSDVERLGRKPESVYNIDEETRMGPDTTNDSMLSMRDARQMKADCNQSGGLTAPIKNAIAAAHQQPHSNAASFSALSFIASEYAESENSSRSPSASVASDPDDHEAAAVEGGAAVAKPVANPSDINIVQSQEETGVFAAVDNFQVESMSLDSSLNSSSMVVPGNAADVKPDGGKENEKEDTEDKRSEMTAPSTTPAVPERSEPPAFHLPKTFGKGPVPSPSPPPSPPVNVRRQEESMDAQDASGLSLVSASTTTVLDAADESTFSRQIESTRDSMLSFPEESVDSPSCLDTTKDAESTAGPGDTSVSGFTGLRRSKPDLEDSNLSLSLMDESSMSKDGPPRPKRARCIARLDTDSRLDEEGGVLTAERLFEYQWPQDGGEWYLLQEQLSEYLGVKSFKRKYPDLTRRVCDKLEKDFLREKNVVTEHQSDMGLTAVRSDEVYDLMMKDYPDKYQEYLAVLHQRQKQTISETHKEYEVSQPKLEKSKMADYIKKAAKSAAEFNKMFQRERREERRAYFDLQTFHIQFPVGRYRKLNTECTKPSPYPVSLIPGQFQDHYCSYTSDELRYFPLNTALFDPPKKMGNTLAKPTSSDSSEESGEDKSGSSSESGSGSTGSSDSDVPPTPPPPTSAPPVIETPVKTPAKRAPKKAAKVPRKKKEVPTETPVQEKPVVTTETPAADSAVPDKPKSEEVETCHICTNVVLVLKNKKVETKLIKCSECGKIAHPSCLDLTEKIVQVISTYPWQCMECKTCVECMDPHDEDKMMFCDRCDRGYHTFCVGLRSLPTGRWECRSCKGNIDAPKSKRGRILKKADKGDSA